MLRKRLVCRVKKERKEGGRIRKQAGRERTGKYKEVGVN